MNRLSRAIYYVLLRKINRHAHTFGIAIKFAIGGAKSCKVAIGGVQVAMGDAKLAIGGESRKTTLWATIPMLVLH